MIMCINSASVKNVYHYNNVGYFSTYLDAINTQLGLSGMSVYVNNTNLVCSFTRQNSNANSKYLNTNTNSPYLIVAYGPVGSTGSKIISSSNNFEIFVPLSK